MGKFCQILTELFAQDTIMVGYYSLTFLFFLFFQGIGFGIFGIFVLFTLKEQSKTVADNIFQFLFYYFSEKIRHGIL